MARCWPVDFARINKIDLRIAISQTKRISFDYDNISVTCRRGRRWDKSVNTEKNEKKKTYFVPPGRTGLFHNQLSVRLRSDFLPHCINWSFARKLIMEMNEQGRNKNRLRKCKLDNIATSYTVSAEVFSLRQSDRDKTPISKAKGAVYRSILINLTTFTTRAEWRHLKYWVLIIAQ